MLTLAGLTLNRADPESSNLLAGFSKIHGWHKRAPMRVPRERRTGHGEFAIAGKLAGRVITIDGWCVGEVRAEVGQWLEGLAATLGDGGFGDLTVTDDDLGEKSATVQLLDDDEVDWDGRGFAKFQIILLAPDPFRYGTTSTGSTSFATDPEGVGLVEGFFTDNVMDFGPLPTSDGTVTVTNEGSAPAYPVFYVDGPGPAGGFSVLDLGTGRRITYLGGLPEGSSVVFDSAAGSVVIDGSADRRGDTIVTGWPVVAPGESATFRFAPESNSSAAVLSVLLRSTYY